MDCPRCNLAMIPTQYEQENVLCCQACWGYWLSNSQLDGILHKLIYKFDETEKQKIMQGISEGDVAVPANVDNLIKCPKCRNDMVKKPYREDCPVVIDQCILHGVWLDTGELKALQIYMEEEIGKGTSSEKLLHESIQSMEQRLVAVEEKLDYLINFIRKVRGE